MKTPDTSKPSDDAIGEEREKRFKKVKKDLRIIKAGSIEAIGSEGVQNRGGDIADSTEIDTWQVYDSVLADFEENFRDVLPEGDFETYLKTHFEKSLGNLVGMELGGPGSKLFAGFPKGIFKETVGVALNDLRSEEQKVKDAGINHEVIRGDVFLRKPDSHIIEIEPKDRLSFRQIEDWIDKHGKVDFLIERMVGGHDMIRDREIFAAISRRWFELLSDDGVMFIEAPKGIGWKPQEYEDLSKVITSGAEKIRLSVGRAASKFVLKIEKIKAD